MMFEWSVQIIYRASSETVEFEDIVRLMLSISTYDDTGTFCMDVYAGELSAFANQLREATQYNGEEHCQRRAALKDLDGGTMEFTGIVTEGQTGVWCDEFLIGYTRQSESSTVRVHYDFIPGSDIERFCRDCQKALGGARRVR